MKIQLYSYTDSPLTNAVLSVAHQHFLESGVDIIETNTYQASIEGLCTHLRLSEEEAARLIKSSVTEILRPVCDQWYQKTGKRV